MDKIALLDEYKHVPSKFKKRSYTFVFPPKIEVPTAEGGGESKMRETTAKGRESPILLAAKNGIIEMVERILEVFPMAALDRDSDGKNLVILAVENRQTKLYARLLPTIIFNHNAFGAVDNDGNSALHVAATLGNYQPYPFAALQMQWEIKWFKVYMFIIFLISSCFNIYWFYFGIKKMYACIVTPPYFIRAMFGSQNI